MTTATATYQPVLEIASAYDRLTPSAAARLDDCFAGELNIAQTLAAASLIVNTTPPADLAYVVARLICMASEPAGIAEQQIDMLLDLPDQPPQALMTEIRNGLHAIEPGLRMEFVALQERDINLPAIADAARRVVDSLAPCEMWRVLAGQMLVTAADHQMQRARTEFPTHPGVDMTTAQLDRHSMLTTRQAAQELGVSLRTIQLWCGNGRLTHLTTVGGHRRIDKAVLAALKGSMTRTADADQEATPTTETPLVELLKKVRSELAYVGKNDLAAEVSTALVTLAAADAAAMAATAMGTAPGQN